MRAAPRRTGGRPPLLLIVPAAVGLVFLVLPIAGLLARTPWSDLPRILTTTAVADALRISLSAAVAAAVASALIGVPLAWILARWDFPGRGLLRGLVILPMVLPPVVGGAALLFAFGRRGLLGGPLYDATGFLLPFSQWGVVTANTFIAMPFLVLAVEGGLHGLDQRYEAAAASLGARRWTVFRRVTLPMVAPSLTAGLLLAWARALGEFGATITFAGNLQGRTQTLPLAVFVALQNDRGTAIAISLILIVVSLAILFTLRTRWWPLR